MTEMTFSMERSVLEIYHQLRHEADYSFWCFEGREITLEEQFHWHLCYWAQHTQKFAAVPCAMASTMAPVAQRFPDSFQGTFCILEVKHYIWMDQLCQCPEVCKYLDELMGCEGSKKLSHLEGLALVLQSLARALHLEALKRRATATATATEAFGEDEEIERPTSPDSSSPTGTVASSGSSVEASAAPLASLAKQKKPTTKPSLTRSEAKRQTTCLKAVAPFLGRLGEACSNARKVFAKEDSLIECALRDFVTEMLLSLLVDLKSKSGFVEVLKLMFGHSDKDSHSRFLKSLQSLEARRSGEAALVPDVTRKTGGGLRKKQQPRHKGHQGHETIGLGEQGNCQAKKQ